MGFSITIGEAMAEMRSLPYFQNLTGDYRKVSIKVSKETHALSESQKQNNWGIGYGAYKEFCENNGLSSENFIREHGVFHLEKRHLERIKRALSKSPDEDELPFLKWFEFWMEWALENCKVPAIEMN